MTMAYGLHRHCLVTNVWLKLKNSVSGFHSKMGYPLVPFKLCSHIGSLGDWCSRKHSHTCFKHILVSMSPENDDHFDRGCVYKCMCTCYMCMRVYVPLRLAPSLSLARAYVCLYVCVHIYAYMSTCIHTCFFHQHLAQSPVQITAAYLFPQLHHPNIHEGFSLHFPRFLLFAELTFCECWISSVSVCSLITC